MATQGTPFAWHFINLLVTPVIEFSVYVMGEPDWDRPVRARRADDPNGGPPTLISRGGPLARRVVALQFYVPWGDDLEARLTVLRDAYNQRGPYTLTTHRESIEVAFDPVAGWREQDFSTHFIISTGLAEVS